MHLSGKLRGKFWLLKKPHRQAGSWWVPFWQNTCLFSRWYFQEHFSILRHMPSTNQTDGAKHIGPTTTEKKFKRNKTNTNKKISELFAVIVSYSCCNLFWCRCSFVHHHNQLVSLSRFQEPFDIFYVTQLHGLSFTFIEKVWK